MLCFRRVDASNQSARSMYASTKNEENFCCRVPLFEQTARVSSFFCNTLLHTFETIYFCL